MKNQLQNQILSVKSVNKQSQVKRPSLFPAILVRYKSKRLTQSKKMAPSYIQKSLGYIDKGCYQNGKLNIDGEYGDHRMKLFRKKDRNTYEKNIPSLFNQDLKSAIYSYALSGQQKKPNQQQPDRSPTKKRGQSLSVIINKNDANNEEDILNMIKSIIQSNKQYLEPEIGKQQNQNQKYLQKGIEQSLRQENGHLLHSNLPEYMIQNWFNILDNSTKDGNKVTPFVSSMIQPKKKIKTRKQHKHIFRFLQKCKPQSPIIK